MMRSRSVAASIAAALLLWACGTPSVSRVPLETLSATPRPPTPTITASPLPPTATATLAPAARTFTEGFDAGAPHWEFFQAGAAGQAVTPGAPAGTLRFDLPGPDQWAYAVYADQEYEDVRVDAVVEFGASTGSSAGVICRYDASLGWYEFNIHPDRTYTILFGRWLADGIARYTPLVVSESEDISPTINEIGLVCQDNVLTPYVNTVQLRRRQETLHVLTDGRVGVTAASSGAGGQAVAFDWISVGNP
jgi:hypothetical protein